MEKREQPQGTGGNRASACAGSLWDDNLSSGNVLQIMRRYHIQGRDDYKKYSKLCGNVTRLVNFLKKLDSTDPVRIELTDELLEK